MFCDNNPRVMASNRTGGAKPRDDWSCRNCLRDTHMRSPIGCHRSPHCRAVYCKYAHASVTTLPTHRQPQSPPLDKPCVSGRTLQRRRGARMPLSGVRSGPPPRGCYSCVRFSAVGQVRFRLDGISRLRRLRLCKYASPHASPPPHTHTHVERPGSDAVA